MFLLADTLSFSAVSRAEVGDLLQKQQVTGPSRAGAGSEEEGGAGAEGRKTRATERFSSARTEGGLLAYMKAVSFLVLPGNKGTIKEMGWFVSFDAADGGFLLCADAKGPPAPKPRHVLQPSQGTRTHLQGRPSPPLRSPGIW